MLISALNLISARFSQPVLTFLLFTAAARYLNLEDLGAYLVLMSFMFILQAASILGLGPLLTREISQDLDNSRAWLGTLLLLGLPCSLLVWAAFPAAMHLLGYQPVMVWASVILGAALPLSVGLQSAESIFLSHGRALPLSLPSLLEGVVRLAISLAFLLQGYGLVSLMWAFVIGRAVGLAAAAVFLHPLLRGKGPLWDRSMARVLLRSVPVFGAMFVASVAFFRLDVVLVSLLMGDQEAGLYGAAYRFAALLLLIPDGVTAVLYPVLSRRALGPKQRLADMVHGSLRILLGMEIPMVLLLMAASVSLLPLIFGPGFIPSAPLAGLLSAMVLPYSINGILGYLLQAVGLEKLALVMVAGSVVVHVCAIIVGVACGGLFGVAWAVLLSMSVFSALLIVVVHHRVTSLGMAKPLLKMGAALASGAILVAVIPDNHVVLKSLAAPAAALLVMLITGLFTPAGVADFYRSVSREGNRA